MFHKIRFLSFALLILFSACIPVGSIEVGVEPTRVVVEPQPTNTSEVVPTEPVVEPTVDTVEDPAAFGKASGGVCFPSEYVPAMTAYFRDIHTGILHELSIEENQTSYSVELPIGTYIAFAYLDQQEDFGGQYSTAVPCGLNIECVDHSPLTFDVLEGQETVAIDICDWYEPAAVPANPAKTISVNPTLENLVFDINRTLYRVGSNGTAEMLLDPYHAQEVAVNADATLAVFTREDDLYIADLSTGAWQNLTNTPDRWERSPVWVPGANQIFFDSDVMEAERFGGGSLTTMSIDGSGYTIIDDGAICSLPAFDPQGTRMVYSGCEVARMYDLESGTLSEFDPADFGLTNIDRIVSPSWSADGQKLAWWILRNASSGSSEIGLAIFDLSAGSHVLKHLYQPVGGGGFNTPAAWSPDGEWVAAVALGDGAKAGLLVLSVNGSGEYDLGSAASPVFSPNSAALIYRLWPQDGGPAWDSTLMTLVLETGQLAEIDIPNGANPIGFAGQ